jgi:hypothetical protein
MPFTKESLESHVLKTIQGHGKGWCFSHADFSGLGSRKAIDMVILRLTEKGVVRRILRGLYEYPRYSKLLGKEIATDVDQVARAIARKQDWTVQANSATSQNYLGLSEQVPGRYEYLSNGPSREYTMGNTSIYFKKTKIRESNFKHRESSLIVQALKGYGSEDKVPQKSILKIKEWIPDRLKPSILKETSKVTGWVYKIIRSICSSE